MKKSAKQELQRRHGHRCGGSREGRGSLLPRLLMGFSAFPGTFIALVTVRKTSHILTMSVEMPRNKLNAHGGFTPAAVAPPEYDKPEQVIHHYHS